MRACVWVSQFQRIFCICFAFDIIVVGICHLSSDCDGIRKVSTKLEFHHFITTTCTHGRARAPQYQANKLKSSRTTKVNTQKEKQPNKTLRNYFSRAISRRSRFCEIENTRAEREREREAAVNVIRTYFADIHSRPADSAHTVTHKRPSSIRTLLIRKKIKHWHIFKHIKWFCSPFLLFSTNKKEITLLMQFENINNHCPPSLWMCMIFNLL